MKNQKQDQAKIVRESSFVFFIAAAQSQNMVINEALFF